MQPPFTQPPSPSGPPPLLAPDEAGSSDDDDDGDDDVGDDEQESAMADDAEGGYEILSTDDLPSPSVGSISPSKLSIRLPTIRHMG